MAQRAEQQAALYEEVRPKIISLVDRQSADIEHGPLNSHGEAFSFLRLSKVLLLSKDMAGFCRNLVRGKDDLGRPYGFSHFMGATNEFLTMLYVRTLLREGGTILSESRSLDLYQFVKNLTWERAKDGLHADLRVVQGTYKPDGTLITNGSEPKIKASIEATARAAGNYYDVQYMERKAADFRLQRKRTPYLYDPDSKLEIYRLKGSPHIRLPRGAEEYCSLQIVEAYKRDDLIELLAKIVSSHIYRGKRLGAQLTPKQLGEFDFRLRTNSKRGRVFAQSFSV